MNLGDIGLECFTTMVVAESPADLLQGLIATRMAEKYDGVRDRDVFFSTYSPAMRNIHESLISPTSTNLRAGAAETAVIAQTMTSMAADEFPGRIRGQLIGTSVDTAAYHLLAGDISGFDDWFLTAFDVAAEITDQTQAWVPVLLAIDLAWPLFWYRVRKYRHERAPRSNHPQNFAAMAERLDPGAAQTSLTIAQYLFMAPEMLRQGDSMENVIEWAERNDEGLTKSGMDRFGFNRWQMAKIIRAYANPSDSSAGV